MSRSPTVPRLLAGLLVAGLLLAGCTQEPTRPGTAPEAPAVETTPAQRGSYTFVKNQEGGSKRPVAWDPCVPIEYYVNDALEPRGAAGLVDEGIEEISAVSGLTFRHLGSTDRRPWTEQQELQPMPEPVVIGWTTPRDFPALSGRTAGGAASRWDRDEAAQELHYVTGLMVLDAPHFRRILRQPGGRARSRAIVLHELGHLVGLLHVDDPGELMHREDVGRLEWGPGDREGLAALGSGTCYGQVDVPQPVRPLWLSDGMTDFTLPGHAGSLHARTWSPAGDPSYVALLCHGYGEHLGRYEHVAARLTSDDAAVYAQDHVGHGKSEGERVLITDFEKVVEDFHLLHRHAVDQHPGLPVVLVGHSMGGMIAARYAQRYGDSLACVVLSGPVLGHWAVLDTLLPLEEMPDAPIDPSTLSRDPAVGEAYVADPLVWHGPFKKPTVRALADSIATIEAGGALETPVLWLHGEDDQLVPYDGTARGWPTLSANNDRAAHKSYAEARHEIFNETNQDEVLDDVLAFVHRHLGT